MAPCCTVGYTHTSDTLMQVANSALKSSNFRVSYGAKRISIYGSVWTWFNNVTDRQTDRRNCDHDRFAERDLRICVKPTRMDKPIVRLAK